METREIRAHRKPPGKTVRVRRASSGHVVPTFGQFANFTFRSRVNSDMGRKQSYPWSGADFGGGQPRFLFVQRSDGSLDCRCGQAGGDDAAFLGLGEASEVHLFTIPVAAGQEQGKGAAIVAASSGALQDAQLRTDLCAFSQPRGDFELSPYHS